MINKRISGHNLLLSSNYHKRFNITVTIIKLFVLPSDRGEEREFWMEHLRPTRGSEISKGRGGTTNPHH